MRGRKNDAANIDFETKEECPLTVSVYLSHDANRFSPLRHTSGIKTQIT